MKVTDRVYGALLITTIRALEKAGNLNEAALPSLERGLLHAQRWGEQMSGRVDAKYTKVAHGIAKRIFDTRADAKEAWAERKEATKRAYEAFIAGMDRETKLKNGYKRRIFQGWDEDEEEEEGNLSKDEEKDTEDNKRSEDDEDSGDEEERQKSKHGIPWYAAGDASDATFTHDDFKLEPAWKAYQKYEFQPSPEYLNNV